MTRRGALLGLAVLVVAALCAGVVIGQTRSAEPAIAEAPCESGTAVANPADNPGLVRDCAVLLAVKDTLQGTATLNWSADLAIGSWSGITLGGEPRRVTRIRLPYSGLSGTIPSRLGELEKLEHLLLYGNALTGEIPAGLGSLGELRVLYLNSNRLEGGIPAALGNLPRLTTLALNGNRLTGAIPAELGSLWNLRELFLENNRLSGAIPEVLEDAPLRSLYLGGNSGLTGCLPAGLRTIASTDVATLGLGDCPPRPRFTLTTSVAGGGGITPPAGAHTYGRGARVRVTAISNSALRVASWGGDCAGTPVSETVCLLTMDGDKTVSLTFERVSYTLRAEAVGGGSVEPGGTTEQFQGSTVRVRASWDEATHTFEGWSGDCQGRTATCWIIMDSDKTATATFRAVVTHTLTVTLDGEGGSVTPSGATTHDDGAEVTLTASWNDATHRFTGWGGDCSGTTTTCVLTMDENKTVTATFAALAADRCATTTAADCIRAVYLGAPDDYAQVQDIPADVLLTPNSDGRYYVERGRQYTVVTAAPLPAGWTRFWLEQTPLGTPSPVSASRLVPPVGTTYTFTVSEDEAAATLITFDLKRARPFVRPRPDGKPEIGDTVVTTVFSVEAETLSYNSYDTSGAVTTPGSYAFLSAPDDTSTAVTTYEALRDGSTTALLIHKSDAHGASQAALYDAVEVGDLFEWHQADDCFVRYMVTEVMADLAGAVPRKLLAVEWMTYAFTGCYGEIPADAAVRLIRGELPALGGDSLTAPVVVGFHQIVPRGWTGTVKAIEFHWPDDYSDPASLADAAPGESPPFDLWRELDLPEGWSLSEATSGGVTDPSHGFSAYFSGPRGGIGLVFIGYFLEYRHEQTDAGLAAEGIVTEARVIAGRPALYVYSPPGENHDMYHPTTVHIVDRATETGYTLRVYADDVLDAIELAESLFEESGSE